MTEEMLLIAFVSFVVLLVILVLILRNLGVQDVLGKDNAELVTRDSPPADLYPQPETRKASQPSLQKNTSPGFELDREKIHKLSKVLSIIGAVALFLPAPDFVKFVGLGFLFLGSVISKATKPVEQKKKKKTPQSQTFQKIRLLASKPEYGEAMKLLYADKKENPQAGDAVHYKRAIQYLEKHGISADEARQNLVLLAGAMEKGRK